MNDIQEVSYDFSDVSTIVIKYHSLRMLTTVDLENIFTRIIDKFGERCRIIFEQMSSEERKNATSSNNEIVSIIDRFRVFLALGDNENNRLNELEELIVKTGRK